MLDCLIHAKWHFEKMKMKVERRRLLVVRTPLTVGVSLIFKPFTKKLCMVNIILSIEQVNTTVSILKANVKF